MYKINNIVNNIIRGEYMKKTIGMMALGIGMGAGAMFMYEQYKNGNLANAVEKGSKELTKAVNKSTKKNNDSN